MTLWSLGFWQLRACASTFNATFPLLIVDLQCASLARSDIVTSVLEHKQSSPALGIEHAETLVNFIFSTASSVFSSLMLDNFLVASLLSFSIQPDTAQFDKLGFFYLCMAHFRLPFAHLTTGCSPLPLCYELGLNRHDR